MAKLSLFGKGKPKAEDPKDEDKPAATAPAAEGDDEEKDDPPAAEGDEPEEEAAAEDEEDEVAESQAALDQAVASQKASRADVARLARAAERARVAAILGSEEAAARPTAARTYAFETDLAPDRVAAKLAKQPPEAAARGGLAAAMAGQPQPSVRPDAGRSAAKPTAGLRSAVNNLLPRSQRKE